MFFHAAQDHAELTSVDARERTIQVRRLGQLEVGAVQTLVEDAEAIVIEPDNLDPIAALAREDEERTALRIEVELLLDREREGIERPAHVLALRAHEDPNARRDHRRLSSTS